MKNVFLNPHLLYLVDTGKIEFNQLVNDFRFSLQRKNVAVLEVSNHFFELETLNGKIFILGREIPIHESSQEFIDITTFQKFPYDQNFDFENVNLRSLRVAYRKYQILNQQDVSMFGITKLYHGKIRLYQNKDRRTSIDFMEDIRKEIMESLLEMDAFFIQFEDGKFMRLADFIDGRCLQGDLISRMIPIEFNPIEEIPLKELKSLSIPYFQKKKCLQFPKSNI